MGKKEKMKAEIDVEDPEISEVGGKYLFCHGTLPGKAGRQILISRIATVKATGVFFHCYRVLLG